MQLFLMDGIHPIGIFTEETMEDTKNFPIVEAAARQEAEAFAQQHNETHSYHKVEFVDPYPIGPFK
jgi:hypothetical protein